MSWQINIDSEGIDPDEWREMMVRFWNWRPIKMRLQKIWAVNMRREYQRNPVGQMKNLGPSILGDRPKQISMGGRASYTVGSRVFYAGWYDQWRRAKNMTPLFNVPPEQYEDLAEAVMVWTIYGEGHKKHRVKKRKHS